MNFSHVVAAAERLQREISSWVHQVHDDEIDRAFIRKDSNRLPFKKLVRRWVDAKMWALQHWSEGAAENHSWWQMLSLRSKSGHDEIIPSKEVRTTATGICSEDHHCKSLRSLSAIVRAICSFCISWAVQPWNLDWCVVCFSLLSLSFSSSSFVA